MTNSVIAWTLAQGISIPEGEKQNWRPLRDASRYCHVLFGPVLSGITDGILGYVETRDRGVCHVSLGQMDKGANPEPEMEEETDSDFGSVEREYEDNHAYNC